MNHNKKITFTLSFIAFAVSVYLLASAALYRPSVIRPIPSPAVSPSDAVSREPSATATETTVYEPYRIKVIRLYRGRIAVFEENAETPIQLLPGDPDRLPSDAVERLREGIYAYTAEQYRNYLEDFS